MIAVVLGFAWLALAALVSPKRAPLVSRLRPSLQAGLFVAATAGLALIPFSVILVLLSPSLYSLEASGSTFTRCGRLIAAIFTDPFARPEITVAVALLLTGAISVSFGAASAWRSQAWSRRLIRRARTPIVVVASSQFVAFTAGFIRPKVVASESLMHAAPEEWRRVVLAHEEAHRRARHPLLIFLVETFARGIPLLPLRWSVDALRLALEMHADDRASRLVGSRTLVAEAVAGMALAPVGAAVAFEGEAVRRVRRLVSEPPGGRLGLGVLVTSGILALLVLAGGHAVHCGEAAFETLAAKECRVHMGVMDISRG